MEDFTQYIQPELVILIPVLYLIGMAIKRYGSDDRVIPLVLGLMGMLLSCLYGFSTMTASSDVAMVLYTGIVQGILCAGAAVYAHNIYKQATKAKGE